MSRYIDADKMLAYISRLLGVLPLALLNEYEKNGIDIVRCKECKYCKRCKSAFRGEPIFFYRCAENNRDVESDDYCSWGEREGE